MTRLLKASLLLFFFSLCGAAFVVTYQLGERRAAPLPHELFSVVNEQLAAMRAADFPGAYRKATSGVQQKFTLPQFEAMVRRNYAEMTAAHRVEFGAMEVQGSSAYLQVFFFSENGSARAFVYNLVAETDGWKIGGVEEWHRYRGRRRPAGTNI
jgi:hypothetical protein